MPSNRKAAVRVSLRKQVEALTARIAALEAMTRPPVIHSVPNPSIYAVCRECNERHHPQSYCTGKR